MLYGDMKETLALLPKDGVMAKVLRYMIDDAPGAADGKYELGDGVSVTIKHYQPAPTAERRYETHIKFADVQVVLKGEELMYNTKLRAGMTVTEDRLEKSDVRFHTNPASGPEQQLLLVPGVFALVLPEDAHKPECRVAATDCRKAIAKIPVELLAK